MLPHSHIISKHIISGWQFGVINQKCRILIHRKWLLLANPWLNVLSLKEYNANYFT